MCVIKAFAITVMGLCLVLSNFAFASRVGHTIRNGGGGAELLMTELWSKLDSKLNKCIHPLNPCTLMPSQVNVLSRVLDLKQRCYAQIGFQDFNGLAQGSCGQILNFNSRLLYAANGVAHSEVQLIRLMLEGVHGLSCSSSLAPVPVDYMDLARVIFNLKNFYVLNDGAGILHLSSPVTELRAISPQATTDLLGPLKAKLMLSETNNVDLEVHSIRKLQDGFEIQGRVSLESCLSVNFVMLFSDIHTLVNPNIILLEGFSGISQIRRCR
jgi:hypothetical protein